ncbi:MAG TPA: glycosyltransferase family 2 protein [Puia sp.]|jgi:glycosyltransferase involved in cell wall biosynthesis|nr:glycosyltransferase family 2 protein [Puia sp.]
MPYNPVLAIVIPVYNEEQNLGALLRDWQNKFKTTGVSSKIILIDDGSKDNSLQLLKALQQKDPALYVQTQTNAGHGPAILKGYRLALEAEWVFQIDSDHQLDTRAFTRLWENRDQYDLLLAERTEKNASLPRRCVSVFSKAVVRLLYGSGIRDVNSPYRLMRASELRKALERIPEDSFAPNVLLTSWFIAKKKHIFTTSTELRTEGDQRRSKMNSYFLKGVVRSAIQTIQFRLKL